ncbi:MULTISPECIES: PfkB family carbohydrate kinase [unclassified Bartonella]|nr:MULTISPECIES: PfkB family carbohydrate kinase [unclassified Bartonella]
METIAAIVTGDNFNGGLVAGLTKDMSFAESNHLAAACGVLATTKKKSI